MKRLLPVLLLALLLPASALAEGGKDEAAPESRKLFTTSLNFGGLFLEDTNIQSIYGSQGRFFTQLTFGIVPLSKYIHLEIDVSIAFSQFSGQQVFVETGAGSADKVMLTLFPVTVDLLVGVDIADEQPVVPYGGVGFNYTLWRENEHGGGQEWSGDKLGISGFFGAAFLLDVIEKHRSRALDASTGINDAYLTLEGRYRKVDGQIRDGALVTDGLNFGGWSVMGGVKLAY